MRLLCRLTTGTWLAITAGVGIVERIVLFITYPTVHYSDTNAYRGIAETIFGDWTAYSFIRTPGYPFLLAVLGPDRPVYMVQLALGLLTSLLLFYIGWRVSGKGWFGALAGLAIAAIR